MVNYVKEESISTGSTGLAGTISSDTSSRTNVGPAILPQTDSWQYKRIATKHTYLLYVKIIYIHKYIPIMII